VTSTTPAPVVRATPTEPDAARAPSTGTQGDAGDLPLSIRMPVDVRGLALTVLAVTTAL